MTSVVLLLRQRVRAHHLPQRRAYSSHSVQEEDDFDAQCLKNRGGGGGFMISDLMNDQSSGHLRFEIMGLKGEEGGSINIYREEIELEI